MSSTSSPSAYSDYEPYVHGGPFYRVLTTYLFLSAHALRQVRELFSSRDLEGVLDMPRRDGTQIRL